jgi:SAM-dependent methyltransferase
MEPHEYQTLHEFEPTYWWYRGLRTILLDILRSGGVSPASRILDAGCGTGYTLVRIEEEITRASFGLDASVHVLPFWGMRGLKRVSLGSVNQLPFADETFDAVLCVDVLECDGVDEQCAFGELCRVTRVGGMIVLVVPAYRWLLTRDHHRAVHSSRRNTRKSLRALIESRPSEVVRLSYLFMLLFPLVVGYRLLLRLAAKPKAGLPRSELRPLPLALNEALYRVVAVERGFFRLVNLPFGSSLVAVVRKASPS